MSSRFIGFFLISVILVTPRSFGASPAKHPYVIGKDDVLEISVWQSPDLTKTVTVDVEGNVEYGFLGKIRAAGLTTAQLQKGLTDLLSKGYVKNPKIDVAVKEYNSKKILVFGDVHKPGLYKLKGNLPLLELLFLVEGVNAEAKRLTVIRSRAISDSPVPEALRPRDQVSQEEHPAQPEGNEEEGAAIEVDLISLLSKGDLSQNITIMPGDTIYVSSGTGQKYYVLGQVKNPGPYEWVQDITVLDAIKKAEGPTELAALNRIKVRKKKGGREEEFRVNVVEIMKGKRKDDVEVDPDTIVIVPKSWV